MLRLEAVPQKIVAMAEETPASSSNLASEAEQRKALFTDFIFGKPSVHHARNLASLRSISARSHKLYVVS